MSGRSVDDTDRLCVFCHHCKKRLGVAQTDPEARDIAENHRHEDVSWDEEPARSLYTETDGDDLRTDGGHDVDGTDRELYLQPVTQEEAFAFVDRHHETHDAPQGWKFGVGVNDGEAVVGVAVVGRPVSRHQDDGVTLEATRCCTDGTKNAASKLYAAAWRAAKNMGYRRLITYTLADSEDGVPLRAVDGYRVVHQRNSGGDWASPSRPRVDTSPEEQKTIWEVTEGQDEPLVQADGGRNDRSVDTDTDDDLRTDGGRDVDGSEREQWPVGEYHSCFECGDEVHENDAEYDERSPGSYFVLCPDCSVDAATDRDDDLRTDGERDVDGIDRENAIKRLRTALHEDVEIIHERGTVIEGPSGTQLVNGRTHDVETWIDRRSRWGNPFKIKKDGGDHRRYDSVELYRGWFRGNVKTGEWTPGDLRGDVLGCWCLPEMCHGVVVMNYLAETYNPQQRLVTDGGTDTDDSDRYKSAVTDEPVGAEVTIEIAGDKVTGEVKKVRATVPTGGLPEIGETVTFKTVGGETKKTVSSIVDGQSHPIRFREGGAAEPQHLVEYSKKELHKIIELPDGRELWEGSEQA
jgi:uncharacterized CHY-type Zn-finger protein